MIIYQDRLGTNRGKTQKERCVFLQAGQAAYSAAAFAPELAPEGERSVIASFSPSKSGKNMLDDAPALKGIMSGRKRLSFQVSETSPPRFENDQLPRRAPDKCKENRKQMHDRFAIGSLSRRAFQARDELHALRL